MSLDKIVVLVLALLFFGGILVLAIKNRKEKNGEDQSPSAPTGPQNEEGVSQFQPRERGRRKTR